MLDFDNASLTSPRTLWTLGIIAVLLLLRLRSIGRARKLTIERLWVTPVLVLAVGGLALAQTPLPGLGWLWLVPPFIAGAAIGYGRGRLTAVAIDPKTHALTSRNSAAGVYLLIGLLVVRIALRSYLTTQASAWHMNAAVITDAFVVFAVGLIAAQRLEIFVRARQLLAKARAS